MPGAAPLFADVALARRIEAAECQLTGSSTHASFARCEKIAREGLCVPIAGGVATWTRPGSPLNKVAGLGFAGAVDPAELDALERSYAQRDEATLIELSSLADPSLLPVLAGRGYVLVGFENVLGLRLADLDQPPTALDSCDTGDAGDAGDADDTDDTDDALQVRLSEADELEAWLDVLVSGFSRPLSAEPQTPPVDQESIASVIRDMAMADGYRRYLADRSGQLVGAACIRLDPSTGVAQLCGAATLPEHRRRGVQSALLRSRLIDARAAGSDIAVVTTQPGSTSQHNVQRQGFELLYTRAILTKVA